MIFYNFLRSIPFLIAILVFIGVYNKFDVIDNGKEVEVIVTSIPISCKQRSKSSKAYFRFQYQNKRYTKNLQGKYCEAVKPQKKIILKTNKANSVFVFPDENLNMEFFSIAILVFLGFICFLKT